MADLRIGISGWTYTPWRGVFFPPGWPQKRELEFACRQVNSIEVNGSFYSLQRPESYQSWYQTAPADFVYALKAGRFITHLKRLRDVEVPLANFFASGVLHLREKLGPILWQLPPSFKYDHDLLAAFFDLLPRDTGAVARLAGKHDDRLAGRCLLETDRVRPVRHALEIRHKSFETEEFVTLLRAHDVALVVADTAGKWPFMEDVTSDFVYVRLHGADELYVSGYSDTALEDWARKVRAWAADGRDVYVYFDNDVKVRAPHDAMALAHKLGLNPPPGAPPDAAAIAEVARSQWPALPR